MIVELALVRLRQRGDQLIGFLHGSVDAFDQSIDVGVHGGRRILERTNRSRVEVVLEKEHLVMKSA